MASVKNNYLILNVFIFNINFVIINFVIIKLNNKTYILVLLLEYKNTLHLVGVSKTTHTRHHAEHIVIDRIDANLGGVGSLNCRVRQHQLKSGVINARKVARTRWLMFFRAKGKRIDVDTSVRVTSVVLVRLDKVEVSTFALREAILPVKLELCGDHWILSPAVHVEGAFAQDK